MIQTLAERPGISPPLAPQESAALAKSEQAYVIRSQPGQETTISIIGASPLGAYYGATTLVQLIESAPGSAAAGTGSEIAIRCIHVSLGRQISPINGPIDPCPRRERG